MKKVRYMISDAAAMMHVESHVLRYWEEELELDVPRNEMGHRYYTEENIHQFEQIKKWKEEGYQLKAIKMMLHSDNPELLEQEQAMQSQHLKLVPDQETVPDKDLSHTLPAKTQETKESMNQTVPAGMSKLEQFQLMMNDIVRNAIAENNQSLGQAVSEHVGEKVIKEMNYLMREQEEQEEELHDLISNKNYFGVTEFAETLSLNDNLKALFGMLGNLYTGSDELQTAKKYASEYPRILAAIERLEELHQVLKIYGIDKYVSVELGIVSNYQYYTGIIFAGYTFGSGEPIVKGGRYDELLTYFGKESASIGFAIVIDQLMAALSRQKIEIPVQYQNELIIYDSKMRSEAIKKAMELRTDGRNVELMARDISKTEEDYRTYAKQNHFVNVTFM